ncbi:hypothetical protein Val02_63170 [Virgisporangium aliadipatigenens]|uniref:Uncharacterized protein n=1 Tax=Virgisporangium aliadipatigenens TaxID=741659 RepID=A0A8J3YTA5_9ACTN|nr:hypothetical protein [Virgisporangium aliadipatigenens]GIJ49431.1 hypothetical protein Val02_63170 [Virgisporangium aliadipatigenens]
MRLPFRVETWRRLLFALLSPAGWLVCLVLVIVGRRSAAARVLSAVGRGTPSPKAALLALPVHLFASGLAAYVVAGLVLNLAYPVRVDGPDSLSNAWGGPSLAGAWAVHAVGGFLVFGYLGLWMVSRAQGFQERLIYRR